MILYRCMVIGFTTIVCGSTVAAAPSISVVSVRPSVLPANIATNVTITARITDPSVIAAGVNLLRLNSKMNPTILGQLRDDGKNGDAVAGDRIYTIKLSFLSTIGQSQLQISAAFTGMPRRMMSAPIPLLFISAPSAFAINPGPLSVGGPLSMNTFLSTYRQGGVIPDGGAQIDISNIPLPQTPLNSYVIQELSDSLILAKGTQVVSGVSCIRAIYTDTFTSTLSYKSYAIYCPSVNSLYKFYLSFHSSDSKESFFELNFQQLLDSVKLAP